MPLAWLHFILLLIAQSCFFLYVYFMQHKLHIKPIFVAQSVIIGLSFGLMCDLILGRYMGVNEYIIGYTPSFLALNAAFSYGLFAATVYLMRECSFRVFIPSTVFLACVYEFINLFFPVWVWNFAFPTPASLLFLAGYYIAGAVGFAFAWRVIFGIKFKIFSWL